VNERPPRSERGDTLVEVIVSVVILGIVTAGLLAAMTTTVASSTISRNQANAEAVLTSVAEALRDPMAYPYHCPANYEVTTIPNLPTGWTVTVTPDEEWDGNGGFQQVCTVPALMQKLSITVRSPDGALSWSREIVKGAPS
jgi:type II secretory pathway pseudopilin PulG